MVIATEIQQSPSTNAGELMNEVMTLEEMEQRFESEWILIRDPETDEKLHVLRGTVLFHSPDRDTMYRKALEMPPGGTYAFHFTGSIPEGTAVVL